MKGAHHDEGRSSRTKKNLPSIDWNVSWALPSGVRKRDKMQNWAASHVAQNQSSDWHLLNWCEKKKINWINVQQQLLVVNYMYMNFLLNVRYTCSISDSAYFWTLLQLWKSLNNQSAFASLLQENRTKKSTTPMVSACMYVLFKTHWALRETPTAHQTKSVITNYETITMSSCGWYQQLN